MTQIFFASRFSNPESIEQAWIQRYSDPAELQFYSDFSQTGFSSAEEKAVQLWVKAFTAASPIAVVGAGTGRECWAFCRLPGGRDAEIHAIEANLDMQKSLHQSAIDQQFSLKLVTNVKELQKKSMQVVWISPSINGHLSPQKARIEFYQHCVEALLPEGVIITSPEFLKRPWSRNFYFWASLLLRVRWWRQKSWVFGDSARSFLGRHNPTDEMIYFHFYTEEASFVHEMSRAGAALRSQTADGFYLFEPQQEIR